jgi:hypothetical protein
MGRPTRKRGILREMPSRLVLVPQGMPSDAKGEADCVDVIRRCGGDVRRLIDSPTATVGAFAEHVSRLKAFDARAWPLVILHRTNPVALSIVAIRRELEERVPRLHYAAWIIVHDPDVEPFFGEQARQLGTFDDGAAGARIWSSLGGLHYLVVRPGMTTDFEQRLFDLVGKVAVPLVP